MVFPEIGFSAWQKLHFLFGVCNFRIAIVSLWSLGTILRPVLHQMQEPCSCMIRTVGWNLSSECFRMGNTLPNDNTQDFPIMSSASDFASIFCRCRSKITVLGPLHLNNSVFQPKPPDQLLYTDETYPDGNINT